MKTLVLGLGKSGKATYALLALEGDEVVGYDDNPALGEASPQKLSNLTVW